MYSLLPSPSSPHLGYRRHTAALSSQKQMPPFDLAEWGHRLISPIRTPARLRDTATAWALSNRHPNPSPRMSRLQKTAGAPLRQTPPKPQRCRLSQTSAHRSTDTSWAEQSEWDRSRVSPLEIRPPPNGQRASTLQRQLREQLPGRKADAS